MTACLVAVIVCAMGQVSPESPLLRLKEFLGPSHVTSFTGNGGLTVSVNPFGRVTACKWPSPAYHDQISYGTYQKDDASPRVAPSDGVMWGISQQGTIDWLAGPPWRTHQEYAGEKSVVIKTSLAQIGQPLHLEETLFVHPERDLLVAHIAAKGQTLPLQFHWYGNFTPCTRYIPELPIADWLLDPLNDFAAFVSNDAQTVYHFRPLGIGSDDWTTAEELVREGNSQTDWAAFEDREGVWIAYTSPQSISKARCGIDGEANDLFEGADSSPTSRQSMAVGQCFSVVTLAPSQAKSSPGATVYIAFGKTKDEVDTLLAYARERSYEQLLEETERHWAQRLKTVALPSTPSGRPDGKITAGLRTLLLATNRATGSAVRAPTTWPPLALDWPRDGIWTTLALDYGGFHEEAQKHLTYYAQEFRRNSRPGKPTGSMAAASYTDHGEALPGAILDAEAVGWVLWSFWRHGDFLNTEDRRAFFQSIWEPLVLATDFLVTWVDARTNWPLHSFDYHTLRDRQTQEGILVTYLGIESALNIAHVLAIDPPGAWGVRKDELDVLIRVECLEGKQWNVANRLPYLWTHVLSDDDPGVQEMIAEKLEALNEMKPIERARTLAELALMWRDQPSKLKELQGHLLESIAEPDHGGETTLHPDSLLEALSLIAIYISFS